MGFYKKVKFKNYLVSIVFSIKSKVEDRDKVNYGDIEIYEIIKVRFKEEEIWERKLVGMEFFWNRVIL